MSHADKEWYLLISANLQIVAYVRHKLLFMMKIGDDHMCAIYIHSYISWWYYRNYYIVNRTWKQDLIKVINSASLALVIIADYVLVQEAKSRATSTIRDWLPLQTTKRECVVDFGDALCMWALFVIRRFFVYPTVHHSSSSHYVCWWIPYAWGMLCDPSAWNHAYCKVSNPLGVVTVKNKWHN